MHDSYENRAASACQSNDESAGGGIRMRILLWLQAQMLQCADLNASILEEPSAFLNNKTCMIYLIIIAYVKINNLIKQKSLSID